MSSMNDHNNALIQNGYFTAADLEANKQGKYSPGQIKQFEDQRAGVRQSTPKYQNKGWIISVIFGMGACFFAGVLYFLGVFDTLQASLGSLFLPVMAGAGILVALFVFVIAPRQYQSSVDMYQSMGTPLAEEPLGPIQVIEARADVYKSQSGINRRGHQSSRVSYVLQMDSIKFLITESLMNTIQNKRLYRVYATQEHGAWLLLSMEALD